MRKPYQQPGTSELLLTGTQPLMDIYSLDGAPEASEEGNPPMDAKKDESHHYNVWNDDWREEGEKK